MNVFCIIANQEKRECQDLVADIVAYLQQKHCQCILYQGGQSKGEDGFLFTDEEQIPREVECIIALGGDGTMIRIARDTLKREIPLVGVNIGTLGYLTEIEPQNLYASLDKLIQDEFEIEERMLLKGTFFHQNRDLIKDYALNDIVISRKGSIQIINLKIYVNDEYLCSYNADGIILSTPTGSTGYNLSAGGPIVAPAAQTILLTPICAHTLNTRSIVLSADDRITVKIGQPRENRLGEAEISFDGDVVATLGMGDRIDICKTQKKTKIIKLSKISFLEVLREKMN